MHHRMRRAVAGATGGGGIVLPGNLLGRWPFIGNANDTSGKGNHATDIGSNVVLTTDEDGHADHAYDFSFDSSAPYNDYIDFPGDDFRLPSNDFTIHIKHKQNEINNASTAYTDLLTTHDATSGWTIERDNLNANYRFFMYVTGTGFVSTGLFSIDYGTYVDLVIVKNGTDVTVYKDNVSVATSSGITAVTTNTNPMVMGALDVNRAAHHYEGVVDGFQIWDVALNSAQRSEAITAGFES